MTNLTKILYLDEKKLMQQVLFHFIWNMSSIIAQKTLGSIKSYFEINL